MNEYLSHSGKGHDDNPPGRGSGRYPYGSGKRPYQNDDAMRIHYSMSKGEKAAAGAALAGVAGVFGVGVVALKKVLGMVSTVKTLVGYNADAIASVTKFVNGSKVANYEIPLSLIKEVSNML